MYSTEFKTFLQKPGNAKTVRDPAYVAGMLFAISASPEIPMPEKWMPWTVAPDVSHINSKDADRLADALMGQLRWQLDLMRINKVSLPEECIWHKEKAKRAVLEKWLSGLLYAHQQCEPVWQMAWQKSTIADASERLTRCIKCFSLLADVDSSLAASPEHKRQTLIDNLPLLAKQVSQLLSDYVVLAGELAKSLPGQFD